MASFRDLIPRSVTVIRAGCKLKIPTERLVVGDLVEIITGDRISADLRLINTLDLEIDNSVITGDPTPIAKFAERIDENPLESDNLLFFGNFVVAGIKIK